VSVGTTTAPAAADRINVHVAGAVRRPGLYRLSPGARIQDAVDRAGGATRRGDLDGVNLAQKVTDGQQVLVPEAGAAAAAATAGASTAGPPGTTAGAVIDLNSATAEQLETLDGVGPATAAKILEYRASHGPFRAVGDLSAVSGIGPKKLAAIRPRVRV
jgi:competence protein ComEA